MNGPVVHTKTNCEDPEVETGIEPETSDTDGDSLDSSTSSGDSSDIENSLSDSGLTTCSVKPSGRRTDCSPTPRASRSSARSAALKEPSEPNQNGTSLKSSLSLPRLNAQIRDGVRKRCASVSPHRKRKLRQLSFYASDTLQLNRIQTSVPLGWFRQLRKRVCVRFVTSVKKNGLCYCGQPKDEHKEKAVLGEMYGDGDERGASCIVSKTTDPILNLKFKNDPVESLFIRLDYKTKEQHLAFLLKDVLLMRDYKLFLHFLDYEQHPNQKEMNPEMETKIQSRLETGLQMLSAKTKLAITSTGLHGGASRHVHHALASLCKKDKYFHSNVFRLACSPWGLLTARNRSYFISKKTKSIKMCRSCPRDKNDVIMTHLSSWFHHYLLFDEGVVYDSLDPECCKKARVFRDRVEETLDKKNENAVNVCVMMNGGSNVLCHVIRAMERNVPVIIVKGTGGYADILTENLERANTVTKKVMDENGTFKTRTVLILPHEFVNVEKEDIKYVKQILGKHQLLTVFDPDDVNLELNMTIYQALLKCHHDSHLNDLLISSKGDFIGFERQWMDFLIEAFLTDSPNVVDIVLKKDPHLEKHFTTQRVITLYNRTQRLKGAFSLLQAANATNVLRLGVKENLFCPSDVRLVLQRLLYDCYPLNCTGVNCQCVLKQKHADSTEEERGMYRTCLPAVQEMFLWTLLTNHQKLALVIWRHCKDKLASALVAEIILIRLAENEDNADREDKLRENAKEFGDLSVELLRTCYEVDEKKTHSLMRRKSTWWGDQSVMQLAYSFYSRNFISQPACMSLLDRIWLGKIASKATMLMPRILLGIALPPLACLPIIKIDPNERKGFAISDNPPNKKSPRFASFMSAPIVKHTMHVISFVLFLLAFSYVLLVDLQPDFTVWQGVLCVWVATYGFEEIRQLFSVQASTFKNKFRLYWKEGWNQIDVITIAVFILGMALAAVPYEEAYHTRRVLLSLDFIFFCMRLLQAFSIGSEIGPMLTMILKMIRDTVTFMIILLVFMTSYAVASESILFPRTDPHPRLMYYVPRKAYWQMYGDFFLGEIEGTDIDCTHDEALYSNHTLPRCPSKLGQFMVPIMLAVYCIVANVLMLNLLIAKFNDSYSKVQGEARTHWAWYRCQVFHEFSYRRSLPPPFNLPGCLWWLVKQILTLFKKIVCCDFLPPVNLCMATPSQKEEYLLQNTEDSQAVGKTSIELTFKHPDLESSQITRYRILCYKITSISEGVADELATADHAVTLYTSSLNSNKAYRINNLTPNTEYNILVEYEADSTWHEHAQIITRTMSKGITVEDDHETESVEQLGKVRTDDPVLIKLEGLSKTMNNIDEQVVNSVNQLTGHITELQQKESSVRAKLTSLINNTLQQEDTLKETIADLIDNQLDIMTAKLTKRVEELKTGLGKELKMHRDSMKLIQNTLVTVLDKLEKTPDYSENS